MNILKPLTFFCLFIGYLILIVFKYKSYIDIAQEQYKSYIYECVPIFVFLFFFINAVSEYHSKEVEKKLTFRISELENKLENKLEDPFDSAVYHSKEVEKKLMKKLMPRISKLEKKLEDPLYIPSKGKEKGE